MLHNGEVLSDEDWDSLDKDLFSFLKLDKI